MPGLRAGRPVGLFIVVLWIALLSADVRQASSETLFQSSELTVVTASGRYKFRVEIARTPAARRQGLMHRKNMAEDAGMLFDYIKPQAVTMWMKNTMMPLDMLFISAEGVVVNMALDTVPGSLETIPSQGSVLAVLELNGGTVSRLGIRSGDRVEHGIFVSRSGAAANSN